MAEDSDDWTVRKGFSQGSTLINFKLNGATGMDERASWYNSKSHPSSQTYVVPLHPKKFWLYFHGSG